jgi:hypothetical protein
VLMNPTNLISIDTNHLQDDGHTKWWALEEVNSRVLTVWAPVIHSVYGYVYLMLGLAASTGP